MLAAGWPGVHQPPRLRHGSVPRPQSAPSGEQHPRRRELVLYTGKLRLLLIYLDPTIIQPPCVTNNLSTMIFLLTIYSQTSPFEPTDDFTIHIFLLLPWLFFIWAFLQKDPSLKSVEGWTDRRYRLRVLLTVEL